MSANSCVVCCDSGPYFVFLKACYFLFIFSSLSYDTSGMVGTYLTEIKAHFIGLALELRL